MAKPKPLTTGQAATLRKVSRGYIWKLYKAGRLKGEKVGHILTFLEADVMAVDVQAVGRPKSRKA